MSVLAPYKEIASRLSSQYEKAKQSGDLFAYDSTVEHVEEDGVRVRPSSPAALPSPHLTQPDLVATGCRPLPLSGTTAC